MGFMENFLVNNRSMTVRDWAVDTGVAVAAFLFGCMQLMLTASSIIIPDLALRQFLGIVNVVPDISVFVALALTTLPVVLRRRFPWPVFLFVSVTFLGFQSSFQGFSLMIIGPMIALFTIAYERGRTEAIIAAVAALVGLLFIVSPSRTASLAFFERFQNIAFMAAAAFAGYSYRTHRAYVRATEQRAMEAERTREEMAARRVEEERVRIAREVHDITAHSLSAVSIQAAAAERLIDHDPVAAKEAIVAARMTAKEALNDIRSMIGVLRHGEDSADTAPTAGTERLEDIAAFLQDAGLETVVDIAGYDRAAVPAHVDMALYGIAREASTNIVRHAAARHATLRLGLVESRAQLVIEDDGRGHTGADTEGHGIIGMAERMRLLGGTFDASDRPGGGFRVVATVPVAMPKSGGS